MQNQIIHTSAHRDASVSIQITSMITLSHLQLKYTLEKLTFGSSHKLSLNDSGFGLPHPEVFYIVELVWVGQVVFTLPPHSPWQQLKYWLEKLTFGLSCKLCTMVWCTMPWYTIRESSVWSWFGLVKWGLLNTKHCTLSLNWSILASNDMLTNGQSSAGMMTLSFLFKDIEFTFKTRW